MKTMALLLVVPALLLMSALSAGALSLNYDFFSEIDSQHFDHPYNLVNSKIGDEANSQTLSIARPSVITNIDQNTFSAEITKDSMSIWMKDTSVPAPSMVPEPASLILLGGGLLFLAEVNRRWRKPNS